ncbi:hypothetical protein DO97_03010 [Neosynechococcus sphagnicola sy1]|uniref:Segregation and condensation protein A n=1 Tax=Neosynechococcus sphagnicola sy1 TaxID=1497020 RepID=A0A098TL24_9CYAN|nr:segregation/condensation protein A [Neosynechococcus sphagnicola]KGF73025.1 hypothetical protein DO97_03010 [Neosynechococcus sphagnicola sy1]
MTASLAQHAIAQLIDLAERGEIDPWNVQVIEVIDRYLSQIPPSHTQASREAELSQSGQAFLYASMLVLLKAESLVRLDTESPGSDLEDFLEEIDSSSELVPSPLPPLLERRLRRRAAAQPLQQRRVTLKELIDQLQQMATTLEKETVPRPRPRRPRPQSRNQAAQVIAQLAHQENLSEIALELEQLLAVRTPQAAGEEGWVDLLQLLEWQQKSDRVGVFWGLLFLSAQSKVELAQTEFYQDLRVRFLPDLLPVTAPSLP